MVNHSLAIASHSLALETLYAVFQHQRPREVILDVRSPAEFDAGHVPRSRNIPYDEIATNPGKYAQMLRQYSQVYLYCSAGERAQRAYGRLAKAGLVSLAYVRDAGMPEWQQRGYPVESSATPSAERPRAAGDEHHPVRALLVGVMAGLSTSVMAGQVDRWLDRWLRPEPQRREAGIRQASP
jgi:rhodanese-related sulfurtransferase